MIRRAVAVQGSCDLSALLHFSRAAAAVRFASGGDALSSKSPMTFEKRYHELCADPECALHDSEYQCLLEHLQHYKSLQNDYAVKQSDLERAKRAANVCGLDFTQPKRRE